MSCTLRPHRRALNLADGFMVFEKNATKWDAAAYGAPLLGIPLANSVTMKFRAISH